MARIWESAVLEVEQLAQELYGSHASTAVRGVIHVVSAVQGEDGHLRVIKIGPGAPKSSTDFFVLSFWRAHADAILTSAQIMRAEPGLSHALPEALAQFREHALHKSKPTHIAVLTRSGELPENHRMWRDAATHEVLTEPARTARLEAALGERAVVTALDPLDPAAAIRWLRSLGHETIVVEAGPTVANRLYEPPALVDHLFLSRCEARVPDAAIGNALVRTETLFAGLTRVASTPRSEESGRWVFERYDRMREQA